jgi:hypothetical protein
LENHVSSDIIPRKLRRHQPMEIRCVLRLTLWLGSPFACLPQAGSKVRGLGEVLKTQDITE